MKAVSTALALVFLACGALAELPPIPATGPITKEQLDKLPFASQLDEKLKGSELGVEGLQTGIFLPKTSFRQGEPIPALFVVANTTDKPRGLDMRLDLSEPRPMSINSCHVRLTAANGVEWPFIEGHMWSCGGEPHVMVKPHGYYCARGDLSLGGGHGLVPGKYTCEWDYARLKSNTVTFTVEPVETLPHRTTQPTITSIKLRLATPSRWPAESVAVSDVEQMHAAELAALLGSGLGDVYYPSLRDIPSSDEQVRVSAKVQTGRRSALDQPLPDQVQVTIAPARDGQQARIAGIPSFILQAESRVELPNTRQQEVALKDAAMKNARGIVLPTTFRLDLPEDWRGELGAGGKVRLAVIVCGGELEKRDSRTVYAGNVWHGLLRSDWQEIELPPTPPMENRRNLEQAPDARAQVGDFIVITAPKIKELDKQRRKVAPDGTINLPLIGDIEVAGKTAEELHEQLDRALGKYYQNPEFAVEIVKGDKP